MSAESLLNQCHSRMQELAKYVERAKCKLALAVDFNLGDLFRFFTLGDTESSFDKGFVDCNDVSRVARYLNVLKDEGSLVQIHSLVKTFDGDGDANLLFTDLSRAFLSTSNEEYQRLVIERPTFYDRAQRPEEVFSSHT